MHRWTYCFRSAKEVGLSAVPCQKHLKMARGEFTKIDPYTARRKNSMNDAKIVDDVLGLLEIMSTDGDMCQ